MKAFPKYGLGIAAVVVLAGLSFLVQQRFAARKRAAATPRAAEKVVTPVRVVKVARGDLLLRTRLTGEIEPFASVTVAAKVSGRIDSLALQDGTAVSEGVRVAKGARLAVIDHDVTAAQVAQADAALRAAGAAVTQAQAEVADAAREMARLKALFEGGAGAATRQMLDKAETASSMAAAHKAAAEAQVTQAQAALEIARINLRESVIVAPLDGVVARKHLDAGNLVSPGVPILTLLQINPLRVIAHVPQRYAAGLTPGVTEAVIEVEGTGIGAVAAKVLKVYPQADAATRTVPIEILLENRDYRVAPGMYATVLLTLARRGGVVVAPADALVRRGEKRYAYVVAGDVAHEREVVTGVRDGNDIEIESGLAPGESLVITGQDRLFEGASVRVAAEEAR